MQIKTNNTGRFGSCGCGRSPTGQCIGWHTLTEEGYLDKLNLWIAEQAQADKDKDERTLD